jgi:hypothetical protein
MQNFLLQWSNTVIFIIVVGKSLNRAIFHFKLIFYEHLPRTVCLKIPVTETCRVAQSVYRLSYRLDDPGSNPNGDEIFRPSRAHPASCKMGTGSFRRVKCGRGVPLTTHPPSSAAVMEE